MAKRTDGRHPFKWLEYHGQKIRIDRDIAGLLTNMWALGIHTTSSCQGVCSKQCKHKYTFKKLKTGTVLEERSRTANCGDRVWIAFASARDLEKFMNVVAIYEKNRSEGMYEKLNGWASHDSWKGGALRCIHNPENWEFQHVMFNEGVRQHVEKFPNDIPGEAKYYYAFVEDDCPRNNFRIQPQLRFPRQHLDYVNGRLELALKRKKK